MTSSPRYLPAVAANRTEAPGWSAESGAGQTATLRPGDWIVEQPSDIHRAANKTSKPVVIYLATLLKSDAPAATPVP